MISRTPLLAALLLGAIAAPATAQVKVFSGNDTRAMSRIFYYTQENGSFQTKGQFSIDYGTPAWKPEYAGEDFDAKTRGKRWRFGSGLWTRLDTNVELQCGSTTIKPGCYYVVLERTRDDKINLILLDPTPIQAKKWDAFQAGMTDGGISLPMKWTKAEEGTEPAAKLSIKLTADAKKPENVSLDIDFGPHKLSLGLIAKV